MKLDELKKGQLARLVDLSVGDSVTTQNRPLRPEDELFKFVDCVVVADGNGFGTIISALGREDMMFKKVGLWWEVDPIQAYTLFSPTPPAPCNGDENDDYDDDEWYEEDDYSYDSYEDEDGDDANEGCDCDLCQEARDVGYSEEDEDGEESFDTNVSAPDMVDFKCNCEMCRNAQQTKEPEPSDTEELPNLTEILEAVPGGNYRYVSLQDVRKRTYCWHETNRSVEFVEPIGVLEEIYSSGDNQTHILLTRNGERIRVAGWAWFVDAMQ